jgi:L-2-hydroxyglutarate oxidase LhgO
VYFAAAMAATDFLVVGGGVIGLSIARQLKFDYGDVTVTVIEKEVACGLHASGRNSGVLHAGFYYPADSLKARFTRQGNQLLTQYCIDRGLPLNRCGKLVVAQSAADLSALDELRGRAQAAGVLLENVSASEIRAIEPRARTYERALYSPSTATVDPIAVMRALHADAVREGIRIVPHTRYLRRQGKGRGIQTSGATYYPGYVVNAAGLYADRIARDFGFSERYRMLPFKGVYLYSDDVGERLRTNVYPVPDLRMPFLGAHLTTTPSGRTKIGPTAVPVFWREQYDGLRHFHLAEFLEISLRQLSMFAAGGWTYQRVAARELHKWSRAHMLALASRLVTGIDGRRYGGWGTAGIRAQLVDIRRHALAMDFVLEHDDRSMHVLNAVSPGFTCAIPFAQEVCARIASAIMPWRTPDRRALQSTA